MTIASLFLALIATPADAANPPSGRDGLTILDFHADWCGPCKAMRPGLAQLAKAGYPIRSINVEEDPDTTRRYKVTEFPTFVLVDADGAELDRTKGYQDVNNLVRLYREAQARLQPAPRRRPAVLPVSDRDEPAEEADADRKAPARAANPNPWETVVRIRMRLSNNAEGVGSGTIIYSDAKQSIILTCAHIFKEDGRQTPPPSQYRTQISVDLFDGQLGGPGNKQVHYANETLPGKAIDYDLVNDVGLIRIAPGRVLPAAKVVPTYWQPREGFGMITVGCSEGRDATAWRTTILRSKALIKHGQSGKESPMLECEHAPMQGRSGGGLFTDDGFVAGVCDFADPQHGHGLYAVPQSIYKILDRNRLTVLYDPSAGDRQPGGDGAMLARDDGRGRKPADGGLVRGQSTSETDLAVPPPDFFGIKPPVVAANGTKGGAAKGWQAQTRVGGRARAEAGRAAVPAEMNREGADDAAPGPAGPAEDLPDLDDLPRPGKSKWKPVHRAGAGS